MVIAFRVVVLGQVSGFSYIGFRDETLFGGSSWSI